MHPGISGFLSQAFKHSPRHLNRTRRINPRNRDPPSLPATFADVKNPREGGREGERDGRMEGERAERSGRINKCLVANGNRRCHNNIPEATGMLPQLHMLFAIARDGATQSGSPVLGSKWGGGFPLSPSPSPFIHPSLADIRCKWETEMIWRRRRSPL